MSDHQAAIDAAANVIYAHTSVTIPDQTGRIAGLAVAAFVESLVACDTCNGTDVIVDPDDGGADIQECPEPHTIIAIVDPSTWKGATHLEPSEIDGRLLYADRGKALALLVLGWPETWSVDE